MMFEIIIIVVLIVVFLVSFCGLLQKLKMHYRSEGRPEPNTRPATNGETNTAVVLTDEFSPGIFPCAPPPYTEYDLPPKYEEIIKRQNMPQVHGNQLTTVTTQT